MSLRFVWDAAKAESNVGKHGVSFEEAKTIFLDPMAGTINDTLRSHQEDRYVTIRLTASGRVLIVAHTFRSDSEIRIISARLATAAERRRYERE